MIRLFIVQIQGNEHISTKELLNYVRDSVKSMKGCLHPDDPIFNINKKNISVIYGNKIEEKVWKNRIKKKKS